MSEEPVAYLIEQDSLPSKISLSKYVSILKPDITLNKKVTSLYTKEQLQPKVKMTSDEFNEFKQLFTLEDCASLAIGTIERVDITFNNLKNRIFSGSVNECVKNENEFNVLWANYDPDNPEETIEIVPTKKWFVRSKEKSKIEEDNRYSWLYDINERYPDYISSESNQSAIRFDTKEQAELWVNPLTEAVLLPVEGE